jgi:hypothetical protein
MRFFGFLWLTENICHKMALLSGTGRLNVKCPLTSNGHHLHSRRCCQHLVSLCDVSKNYEAKFPIRRYSDATLTLL